MTKNGIFFVTSLKANAIIQSAQGRPGRKAKGITEDRNLPFGNIPTPLRMVCLLDPATDIELFFKRIKQSIWVKTFLGTSRNAVLTQIWIALCVYLLLAFLKFKAKIGLSMQEIIRLLQLNFFERRDLRQ